MDNANETWKRCDFHTHVTAVITYTSPDEEWIVTEDGLSFYPPHTSSISFDLTKMAEAEEAAELIMDTAHWYETARREKTTIEIDGGSTRFLREMVQKNPRYGSMESIVKEAVESFYEAFAEANAKADCDED